MKDNNNETTCKNCGHIIRRPDLWGLERTTRWVFEELCITCQDQIPDPNPERTKRCSGGY